MYKHFKPLVDIMPLMTVIYLLFCFFFQYFYYLPFGIEIINYTSTAEIIFAIVPFSIFVLLTVFTISVTEIFFSPKIREVEIIKSLPDNTPEQREEKIKRAKAYLENNRETIYSQFSRRFKVLFYLISALGLGYSIFCLLNLNLYLTSIIVALSGLVITLTLLCWVVVLLPRNKVKQKFPSILLSASISIFFVMCFSRYCEALSVKSFKTDGYSSFKYEGRIITTDSLNYKIGETSDYLFFFNQKSKKAIVYKRDKVDSLEFQ